MKKISYQPIYVVIVLILALYVVWLIIPKSCDNKIEKFEHKSDRSLIIDSIQSKETAQVIHEKDSLIRLLKTKDSISQIKISKTEASYYALRLIAKRLQSIKVDSFTQVVNGVPIEAYNASIHSGSMCDSLLMFQDLELNIKDSIISYREIQLTACGKENQTKEQALSDLIALNNQEKKEGEKAKKLNKKIPLIGVICANIGALIAIFALR